MESSISKSGTEPIKPLNTDRNRATVCTLLLLSVLLLNPPWQSHHPLGKETAVAGDYKAPATSTPHPGSQIMPTLIFHIIQGTHRKKPHVYSALCLHIKLNAPGQSSENEARWCEEAWGWGGAKRWKGRRKTGRTRSWWDEQRDRGVEEWGKE